MLRIILFPLVFTLLLSSLQAQMWNGTDTLYGNEWIQYDQSYYKILTAEDGIFRLSKSALDAAEVPNTIAGAQFQVFFMGEELPIHVSTNQVFGSGDYIEFFGQKNRGDLDRYVYNDPDEEMLNPEYSLVNDTSAYFLTWVSTGTATNRFVTISNDLNNLPSAETFFMEKVLANFFENNIKESNNANVAESTFDGGEGFGTGFATSHEIALNADNVNTSGGDATVKVRLTTSIGSHNVALSFNGSVQESDNPNGFGLRKYEFNIPSSSVQVENELFIESVSNDFDYTSVSNAWLIYPRNFDFNGETQYIFDVEASSSTKYLEIENFNLSGPPPVIYDVTNNIRIVTTVDNGLIKVKLPASSSDRKLILSNQNTGFTNGIANSVTFTDYTSSDAQFIIISNPRLYNDGTGANFVNEYSNYRRSSQGGNFETEVVSINELYDQFGYGVNRHFISIRNFAHYVKKEWDDPQYVFIIGKARDYWAVRDEEGLNSINNNDFAVPTFGSPGADNLLMTSINSTVPILPIGRIAVASPIDIKNYLDKVQLMESGGGAQTIEEQLWKKRVLHLGGGNNNTNEPLAIGNNLADMKSIIENNKFGGAVSSFFKTSSDPIQIGDSDQIFERINDGVSLITFFGHSAVGTFDFNIENPARYENYGKYPMLLSLGCYSGNIHTSSRGISERFVFLKDKGVVAFGASTGQGYISALGLFAKEYYRMVGDEFYGESIGRALQETIRSLENNDNFQIRTLKQQFTLHGDPSIKINPAEGPDYVVGPNSVSFEPSVLTATLDSIEINFAISNLGFTTQDSITVEIDQELPNGEKRLVATLRVKSPKFEDYHSVTVASFKKEASGQNKLHIRLDTDDEVAESPDPAGEMNNELMSSMGSPGVYFYIFDDSARPVYPPKYGIVNEPSLTLKASTSDGLAPERNYVFQIDTTQFFNSPVREETKILSTGGVVKWSPDIALNDDVVYYWRVSPDSLNAEANYVWESSSFVYLPDIESKGWNQSHYFQYVENKSNSVSLDEESREFVFPEKFTSFRLINKVYELNNVPKGIMNNNEWSDFYRWDLEESVTIVVFNSEGTNNILGNAYGNIWFNENPGEYGTTNTTASRIASFPFSTQTEFDRTNVVSFLENVVPDSAYVVLYTSLRGADSTLQITEWASDSISQGGVNLFNLLESYGATQIREMETDGAVPYTFAFRKSGEVLFEQKAFDSNGVVDYEVLIPSFAPEGNFKTVPVGPSSAWESIIWDYSQTNVADTVTMTVYGVRTDGVRDSLFVLDEPGEYNISEVSVSEYPHLELKIPMYDEVNYTPAQIDKLIVLYEGLPEVAVSSNLGYNFYQDTLQQGEEGLFEISIENIGDYDIDSLLLKYSIVDAFNNEAITYQRVAPVEREGVISATFPFESRALEGYNSFFLEVNPNDDQREQFHFNNFAVKPFFVQKDKKNPLLDVTFDGLHILDGDLVSPKPNILISLNDENDFLSLSDTSSFKLFLKRPGQQVAENIPMDSEWVEFYPDSGGDATNKASIRFTPVFDYDGVFELLVQAEDVTGNQSGDLDYKVKFEVITKSSISNVLNYPNPFSTSTQFVYTLTGEEIPEYFKIQIFTVSGKIIKEITQDEIGPLRVGTHRTDYRWDGTDEYGSRLANGVYLYRVVAKKQGGASYEAFDTGTNSMFKKGFGKLVILR